MATTRARLGGLAAALALATAAVVQGGDEERGFLICYPNAPGSTRLAEPVMERLGTYLSRRAGHPVTPVFFNDVPSARAWLATHDARFGILSLGLFLRWREARDLEAVALSERDGATSERYHLLVRGDAPWTALEDLRREVLGRQAVVWSTHLDDPRFATAVVFGGALEVGEEGDLRVVSTRQPLRALRRMKDGEPFRDQPVDAVLVDDAVWTALQKLSTFSGGVLRPLHSTEPLPTPPVVAFGDTPAGERERIVAALIGMEGDPEGREILDALRVTGFRVPEEGAMAPAVDAYAREEE